MLLESTYKSEADFGVGSFDAFLLHRPAYISAVVTFEGISTNHFHVKWQTNALFLGQITDSGVVNTSFELHEYTLIVARFGDEYWAKNLNGFYSWTNLGNKLEANNSIQARHDAAMRYQVAELLNLGCSLADPGAIQPDEPGFSGINERRRVLVNAKVVRDSSMRPARAVIEQVPLRGSKEKNIPIWTYHYFYEDPQLPFLPTLVKKSLETGGPLGKAQTKFKWLELSDELADRKEFELSPSSFSGIYAHVTVSNEFAIFNTAQGTFINRDRPKRDSMAHLPRFTLIALICFAALLPILLVAWNTIKKQQRNEREILK
jgi:hypothetical protein